MQGEDRVARHAARIDALIAAMTVAEKIGQLNMLTSDWLATGPRLSDDYLAAVKSGAAGSLLNLWGSGPARDIQRIAREETRLGIPLILGFDVVHGHRTIFPVPLGEAAAFDPALWELTARAAAEEAAADGLNLTFAPMLDVSRDPRWGRIVEGPGEDPTVAGRFARAKLAGFQGGDLANPNSIAATAKHLGAYGAVLAGRDYASAEVSERLLYEVYFPPFRVAIEAGTAALMPGFNDLAGIPVTANYPLLQTLVRERWGFDGAMISDYNAITELLAHGVAADLAEAASLALKAGVDIDMMGDAYTRGLPVALERGLVIEADLDRSVRRVLALKARLGLFDEGEERGTRPLTASRREEIRALARDAAARSVVLLANDGGLLPLAPSLKRIAVIGPIADDGAVMIGSWSGAGRAEEAVTILAGLKAALPETDIVFAVGTQFEGEGEKPDDSGIAPAAALAATADLVILCLGESSRMNGEASCRAEPSLPPLQCRLVDAVLAAGRPVVVLLASGRPLMLGDLAPRVGALLATWHLGSESGHAIADLLTGRLSPVGRLPVSWPVSVGQVPIYFARRPSGRPAQQDVHYSSKYLDLPVEPLFAFGHGLTYGRFSWGPLRTGSATLARDGSVAVEIDITNQGDHAAEETAFLFIHDLVATVARPVLELKDFTRLALASGETGTVRFTLKAADLAFPGSAPDFAPRLEPGTIEIFVGPSADRSRLVSAKVELL